MFLPSKNELVVKKLSFLKDALKDLKRRNIKFDIVFIDPPYKDDIAVKATELIISLNLL